MYEINNRRYTGSKYKLMPWISGLLDEKCTDCTTFFDVFAGTGVVTACLLNKYDHFIINDFLYSNEIIYKAFFGKSRFSKKKISEITERYSELSGENLPENYVSVNYGDKYFKDSDARVIGFIREDLQQLQNEKKINSREFCILLASLLYSIDRSANTVGHYDAYIKGKEIRSSFKFDLISPLDVEDKTIDIYREDSNQLVRKVKCDIAFIDPPYNSRQYSRFYHVLENITQWKKTELFGIAMKPTEENMSEYCRNCATKAFEDLICNLDCKYIAVTYNNTYDSKSSSSKNKITLEEIKKILNEKGKTNVYSKEYNRFNAGKTEATDHKEYLFITRVG